MPASFLETLWQSISHIMNLQAASPGNWHMTNQMMMNARCFRGGERMDPWPRKRKRKRFRKSTESRCEPSVPVLLHLNVEGLTARKICVVSQLATRCKALVIIIQETHCSNADQQVISHFTLVGLVSSRKHGLATFVHEMLSWN